MKDKSSVNIQNIILNKLRRDKEVVNVFLTNKVKLVGVIKGFDQFTIALENKGKQTLIYKNNIVSLTPINTPFAPIKSADE